MTDNTDAHNRQKWVWLLRHAHFIVPRLFEFRWSWKQWGQVYCMFCTILTHSWTLAAWHKAQWDAPTVKDFFFFFYPTVGQRQVMTLKFIKAQNGISSPVFRAFTFSAKTLPFLDGRVDSNVAVSTKDHDSSLSCFDFCAPPPASQMFQTVGVLADLCFCSEMKGFCRSTWKRIYQGQEENSVICSV